MDSSGLFGQEPSLARTHTCAYACVCTCTKMYNKKNIKTVNQVEKAELHSEIYREWTWGDFFFYFWNYCVNIL